MDDRQRAFRAWVSAVWSRDERVDSVEDDGDDFGLKVEVGGHTVLLFLGNLFHEVRELDEQGRLARVQRWLEAMLERRHPADDDEEDDTSEGDDERTLLPVLRASSFVSAVGLQTLEAAVEPGKPRPKSVAHRAFLPGLCAMLALDSPASFAYVMEGDLPEEFGSFDEAYRSAIETLASAETDWSLSQEPQGPMLRVASNDSYEASRLLVPGMLAALAQHVEGKPIAIVPERDQLIVAGDARPEMVARLCEMANAEWEASPRSISPALYTLDDEGRLIPYVRGGDDELAQAVQLGHVKLALDAYGKQKEYLDKLHEADDIDIFVASLRAHQRASDGRIFTVAMWGRDIDSLLPITELIDIVGDPEADDSFIVRAADVMAVAASSFEDAGLFPKRYRVRGWASDEVMAELRRRAVSLETA